MQESEKEGRLGRKRVSGGGTVLEMFQSDQRGLLESKSFNRWFPCLAGIGPPSAALPGLVSPFLENMAPNKHSDRVKVQHGAFLGQEKRVLVWDCCGEHGGSSGRLKLGKGRGSVPRQCAQVLSLGPGGEKLPRSLRKGSPHLRGHQVDSGIL